jgi:transcriptional regulator with GAF, ATPase, and Fis domain
MNPQELQLLLSVNTVIATIRERKELFAAVFERINRVLPVDDTGLLVLDKTGEYWQDWAIRDNYQETEGNVLLQQKSYTGWQPFDRWMAYSLHHPGIITVKQFQEQYPEHPFVPIIRESRIQEMLHVPLVHKGKPLGVLILDSSREDTYLPAHLSLVQTLADLIAIAVANILANEEILEREREKEKLLSISQALNEINDRKALFYIIYGHIRQIFPFEDTGLFLINEAKNYHQLLLDVDMAVALDIPVEWQGTTEPIPHKNSAVEWAATHYGITAIEHLPYLSGHPHYPVMVEAGFKEFIHGPLRYGGQLIGMLCFQLRQPGFYTTKDLQLFENIANQIAVSVANILANEEILEREQEKTNLLSISEAISKINNRKELLRVIYQHIQPLFPFDSTSLFVMDEQQDVIYEILDSEAYPGSLQKQLTEENKPAPWKLSCSSKNSWWMQHTPVTNTIQEEALYAKGYTGSEQFNAGLAYGLQHMIGGPMFANGKKIGAICFSSKKPNFYSEAHISMFRSISGQVAVAVANVLSNEEIAEREKIKTIQIEIGKALAEETQWNNRLLRCAILLQKEIPHAMLLTSVLMEGNEIIPYGFYQTGREEYQVLEKEDLLRILGLNSGQYKQYWQNLVKSLTGPIAYGQDEIDNLQKKHPVKERFMNYFHLRHNLLFPMWLSKNKVVVLAFYTKEDKTYQAAHVQLIRDIQNYISLCFDRVLAFDELEKANQRISQENRYLQEEIKNEHNFDSIIGESRVLREVFKNVSLVAATDTTVLVLGETGTGKELIARSLHSSSPRAKNSFIKINCAALPAQLIESELFGHEKGSFTGAFERRIGKFELADGGSIFLDEIGELPLELQSKLLRVLQEKEFERIGGKQTLKCDVRIIAATNRKLEKEVENGRFRADLYYRLNVFPILLPPLRERREDIPLLATYFAHKFCKKMNKQFRGISTDMLDALISYQWPGNIRELENVMEQAVIVSSGTSALELARQLLFVSRLVEENSVSTRSLSTPVRTFPIAKEEREKMEIQAITEALQKSKGRIRGKKGAAQLLDIQPTTLESKMKKYGISKYAFGKLESRNESHFM